VVAGLRQGVVLHSFSSRERELALSERVLELLVPEMVVGTNPTGPTTSSGCDLAHRNGRLL
jgi:hypothetical protein